MKKIKFDGTRHQVVTTEEDHKVYRRKRAYMVFDKMHNEFWTMAEVIRCHGLNVESWDVANVAHTMNRDYKGAYKGDRWVVRYLWTLEDITDRIEY